MRVLLFSGFGAGCCILISGCEAIMPCQVTSSPSGAAIRLGGQQVGVTPCAVTPRELFREIYRTGSCSFSANLDGYRTETLTYRELPESVHFDLTSLSPTPKRESTRLPTDCDINTLPSNAVHPSVAVLDFTPSEGIASGLGETLADFCRQAVQKSNRYVLVDRATIKTILTEQDFTASLKCDETLCLVNYGKKLRAQKLVHGRVAKVGEAYVLSIKMLDVSTGAIDSIQNCKVKDDIDRLVDFVEPTTCQLMKQALTEKK